MNESKDGAAEAQGTPTTAEGIVDLLGSLLPQGNIKTWVQTEPFVFELFPGSTRATIHYEGKSESDFIGWTIVTLAGLRAAVPTIEILRSKLESLGVGNSLTPGQSVLVDQFADLMGVRPDAETGPPAERHVGPLHVLLIRYAYALDKNIEFMADGGVQVRAYDHNGECSDVRQMFASLEQAREGLVKTAELRTRQWREQSGDLAVKATRLTRLLANSVPNDEREEGGAA